MAQAANVPAPLPPASWPTIAGFVAMLQNEVGVDVTTLNGNGPAIQNVWQFVGDWVLRDIAAVSLTFYSRAVYCLGADRFLFTASDVPGNLVDDKCFGPMARIRSTYGMSSFQAGVVTGSSDNGTSVSFDVPDIMKNLTLADLQNLKTPWGREYMGIAQQFSPIWGLT